MLHFYDHNLIEQHCYLISDAQWDILLHSEYTSKVLICSICVVWVLNCNFIFLLYCNKQLIVSRLEDQSRGQLIFHRDPNPPHLV